MIVADTNLLVYLYFAGDQTAHAVNVLRRDSHWVSPPLWRNEFLNVLAGYLRRGMTFAQAQEILFSALGMMSGREISPLPQRVLALISQSPCSSYDCEFAALAQELDVPLVTADKKVLRCFPEIAVSLSAFAD